MKKQLNEIKKMQQLAGIINESQLNEDNTKMIMSQIAGKGFEVNPAKAFFVTSPDGIDYLVWWGGSEWMKKELSGDDGDLFEDDEELIASF